VTRAGVGLAVLGLVATFPTHAVAAPGDLDKSFGHKGRVMTKLGQPNEALNDIAIQPDGKIVAVGVSSATDLRQSHVGGFAVTRYRPSGKLDPSFAGDGVQITGFKNADARLHAVAVQPDGKVVAVGYIASEAEEDHYPPEFAIVRYERDGSLDHGFGSGGIVRSNVAALTGSGSSQARATDVALQVDGSILVAGGVEPPIDEVGFVARYLADGQIDSSFSDDGVVTGPASDYQALAVQPDNRIVAAGRYGPHPWMDLALARFAPDGTPDTTFSEDGFLSTGLFGGEGASQYTAEGAQDLVLQPDGALVVSGFVTGNCLKCGAATFLSRHVLDGSFDSSFGTDGVVSLPGPTQGGSGLALEDDGKLLVAVSDRRPGRRTADFLTSRYDPTGVLDPSFGHAGDVLTDFKRGPDAPAAAAVGPDGDLVVAGTFTRTIRDRSKVRQHFALARYELGS
jgi:uncharacterized delta-60 repeat protein